MKLATDCNKASSTEPLTYNIIWISVHWNSGWRHDGYHVQDVIHESAIKTTLYNTVLQAYYEIAELETVTLN